MKKEVQKKYWRALAESVGGELGDKIAEAMQELYSLYTPDMVDWFANLYDVKRGGYYYSNGARDNVKIYHNGEIFDLLPDAESTQQALRFICDSGLAGEVGASWAKVMPEWMKEQIVRYIKGLQNPNGFFYHPQWTKEMVDKRLSRRARDLGWCTWILEHLGKLPTYDTPGGTKGDGLDYDGNPVAEKGTAVQDSAQSTAPSVAIPDEFRDKESFLAYLDTLNIKTGAYSVGNTLTAICGQLIYRDRELEAEGADYSLRKILIEWLNENMNEELGLWHPVADYYGVNGLMKTSGVYSKIGVLMPNADKAIRSAINAISTDQSATAVTDVYNTWFAVTRLKRNLRLYGGEEGNKLADEIVRELRENAPETLRLTKEKLAAFAKPGGSFSYCLTHSSARSQGMPVTFENAWEGDINATIICSSDILNYIYLALELPGAKVPIFGEDDLERYLAILEANREKALK